MNINENKQRKTIEGKQKQKPNLNKYKLIESNNISELSFIMTKWFGVSDKQGWFNISK